jgi:hypothetical protein
MKERKRNFKKKSGYLLSIHQGYYQVLRLSWWKRKFFLSEKKFKKKESKEKKKVPYLYSIFVTQKLCYTKVI